MTKIDAFGVCLPGNRTRLNRGKRTPKAFLRSGLGRFLTGFKAVGVHAGSLLKASSEDAAFTTFLALAESSPKKMSRATGGFMCCSVASSLRVIRRMEWAGTDAVSSGKPLSRTALMPVRPAGTLSRLRGNRPNCFLIEAVRQVFFSKKPNLTKGIDHAIHTC
jgi:hypothetical protein